ncbi:LuxR C-terminal-related transcriptional regulator [Microvirga yunnanensis]|uniref:LuxR C-terminal-related transcriptional regulator n=1 Tax=Microvirga yunnanensis TaxID=2953740 RepID=UPI0021C5F448|nr:response regulator transcription factor [Microvirga sp. HBU65207]
MNAAPRIALTADDDEFFRAGLRTILAKHLGFPEVIETSSFDEALELLAARNDVALALFDLQMPGMDSPGSLRTVREFFPETRVVMISASTSREDVLMALDAGAHGYIAKGLSMTKMACALGTILEGNIYIPPSTSEIPSDPAARFVLQDRAERKDGDISLLTPRQRQVLELLVRGKSNKEIARMLNLSDGTVKVHMAALFKNLGVNSRAAAAAIGGRHLQPEEGATGT